MGRVAREQRSILLRPAQRAPAVRRGRMTSSFCRSHRPAVYERRGRSARTQGPDEATCAGPRRRPLSSLLGDDAAGCRPAVVKLAPPAAHRAFAKATRRLSKTERIYVVVFARNMSMGPHIRPLRAPRNGWFSSLYVSEPPIVTTIFSSGSSWRTPRTPIVD